MNPLLKKFLAARNAEYLTLDGELNILEMSPRISKFADNDSDFRPGSDVRDGFPELIGLEDILEAILSEQQESFELKGLSRFTENCDPIYFDLHVISKTDDNLKILMLFVEDVTDRMGLEQTLVQATNEMNLLLSELNSAKQYIDKVITSIADALIVTTLTNEIKTVNQAAQRLFEYSEAELIGQPISLLAPDSALLFQAIQPHPLLEEQLFNNIEVVCHTKTGKKIYIAFSCSATQTDVEEGQEAREIHYQNFVYIGRDITESKRIEQRRMVQSAIARILSDANNLTQAAPKILLAMGEHLGWDAGEMWIVEAVQNLDKDVEFLPANSPSSPPQLRRQTTWTRTPTIQQLLLDAHNQLPHYAWQSCAPCWVTEISQDNRFQAEAMMAAGINSAFCFPIQGHEETLGAIALYSSEIQPRDENLISMMLAFGNQLGQFIQRKQVEAALVESEERYRDLFENASDLIQSVAADGRFLYVNRAWRTALGYTETEVAQLSIFDVIHPDCQVHCLEVFQKVMSGEPVESVTAEFITKDRRKISVEGSANCKFVGGKPVATRAIFRDITERLQVEAALHQEKEQTERLLLNILPAAIAKRLKQEQSTIAEYFADATVMFADIVGFTELSARISPTELVEILNVIFSEFDQLAERHNLEKIKTIGDAYMVVGGIPTPQPNSVQAIAEMALDMQQTMIQFNAQTDGAFSIRVGIHSGPVVAGVIGIKKFIYDLWGDAVNIASRMESHGLAGKIQVTSTVYERLQDQFLFEPRGIIPIKGKGEMMTYLLVGRKSKL
jgi:PAS domain S-box-containing protein